MPQLNLGRVVGRDGGFGNASANYVDDGGEPDVEVNLSGEDTQKDIEFTFKNLVRAPIDSSMINQITNDQIINSSKVLTATGLTTLWGKIKSLFALKNHTHGTSGIEDKAITQAKLADHSVGQQQLETSVWDSISQKAASSLSARISTSVSTTHVDFGMTFKSVPQVFVSVHSYGSVDSTFVSAYNISKTGFDLVSKKESGSDTFTVSWLAIV